MKEPNTVTIDPDEVDRAPLPQGELSLPTWARSALAFITEAGSAGEVVSLSAIEPTLTPAGMAAEIGVSRAAIQRRIAAGEIAYRKVGNRYHIPVREVERFRRTFVREMAASLADDF